ncbi:hypothetical protein SLA2020_165120 [Shorea laevis]
MKPQGEQRPKQRICDYCNESTAILFCRADTARLCFSCDRQVHSTNQLFSKHSRWQLCDSCSESPASILCETEHSVLCQNCDWETHNLLVSSAHHRRPIEGFTGCPSVSEFVNIFGFNDLGNKAQFLGEEKSVCGDAGLDGLLYSFIWETPAIASLDELIVASDRNHGFNALDVPSVPKNRNASCGQHKEEILRQLRELAKSEPNLRHHNLHPGNSEPNLFPGYESSEVEGFGDGVEGANQNFVPSVFRTYVGENTIVPHKHLDTAGAMSQETNRGGLEENSKNPIAAPSLPVFPKIAAHELNSHERDTALSRYKEKKRTRRYDKQVRYESRKVRAEARKRIKGRFAKVEH